VEVVLYLSAAISGGVTRLTRSREDCKKADVADQSIGQALGQRATLVYLKVAIKLLTPPNETFVMRRSFC
jgi:hypothetical protein